MLTMLSYTQNVWIVEFRPLIMLEIHGSTIHKIFVACVVLMEAMLPSLISNLMTATWLLLKLCQLHKTLILGKLWLESL